MRNQYRDNGSVLWLGRKAWVRLVMRQRQYIHLRAQRPMIARDEHMHLSIRSSVGYGLLYLYLNRNRTHCSSYQKCPQISYLPKLHEIKSTDLLHGVTNTNHHELLYVSSARTDSGSEMQCYSVGVGLERNLRKEGCQAFVWLTYINPLRGTYTVFLQQGLLKGATVLPGKIRIF